MGKPKKLILETMRSVDSYSGIWDASKLTRIVYPPRTNGLRQIYRIIDRLHVTPSAITLESLLDDTPIYHRNRIVESVNRAKAQRMQISIVQLKEVRLGTWALLWNNLRLAKNWIWLSKDENSVCNICEATDQMIMAHRHPCCLIFHPSALELLQHSALAERVEMAEVECSENVLVLNPPDLLVERKLG